MSTDDINGETYTPEGTGPDGQVVIGDDLKEEARETLASYLSSLTTDPQNRNAFPVDPATPLNEFSLRQADGTPSEFTTGGNDGTEGFTDTMPEGDTSSAAAVPVFETLSNSGKFNPGIGDWLDKNTQEDGHNLLRDVASTFENNEPGVGDSSGQSSFPNPSAATPMQTKISQVLQNNNRFDPMPTTPYIKDNEFSEPGIPVEQGAYGVYDKDGARTSIKNMQRIAYSALMRQTGHNMGTAQSPISAAAQAAALLPNGVQVGRKKVSTWKLRPVSAYNAPDRPHVVNGHLEYSDIDGSPLSSQKSFGVLNNPFEPFASARPGAALSQMTTAAMAFAEILVAAAVFGAIMTVIQTAAASTSIEKKPSSMKKGQYRIASGTAKMLKLMGVPETNQPMWRCVCYGILAFFKIAPSSVPSVPSGTGGGPGPIALWWSAVLLGSGGNIYTLFTSAMKSHGYYATILRSVRRDLEQLLSDLSPTDPPSMFNTIMHLNDYSSWRFMCALAVMGDRFLDAKTKRFAIVPSISGMPMNGQTRQGKSRAFGGQMRLAWRHRGVPSLVLLPQKYANAYSLYGFMPGYARKNMHAIGDKTNSPGQYFNNHGPEEMGLPPGTPSQRRRKVIQRDSHRLTTEDVTQIEDELDSEYMPFYFHDLRTNEVISFQAFIEDVKDSYSVSYAESAGYGRIDPVRIYQNTSRTISVSWVMVATGPKDFDSMWWSINKLVSMCYPQFSMGKPVKAGSKKFVMPFSQIPTASPLIRLRVGDVLRSNYSRFNLARIFGMSEAIPAASAYASPSGTTIDDTNRAEWEGAPFDLTYMEEAEAAVEMAEAAAEAAGASVELSIDLHVLFEPTEHGDMDAGYIPWDTSGLGLGIAMLQANSEGYTTYDMDEGWTHPGTPYPVGDWQTFFPPPTATTGINIEDTAFPSRTHADMKVQILARRVSDDFGDFIDGSPWGDGDDPMNNETSVNEDLREAGQYAEYLVTPVDIDDPADPWGPVSAKAHTHAYVVTSVDMYPIYPEPPAPTVPPVNVTLEEQVFDIYDFFRPDKNAVVRSFESAGGRGLAGVITSFDMDWKDSMWDMRDISRRAPTMIKCSINFSPIHDIVPGLDNNGAMRAYNYPVGKINSGMAEDFYSPGAGRSVPGGRMSVHRGTYVDDDANIDTVEGFKDSVTDGYGSGGAGSDPTGGTP